MTFSGETLSWSINGDIMELELHRLPCNEIGSRTLEELELFAERLGDCKAAALVVCSSLPAGFSSGADLRELYARMQELDGDRRAAQVRDFLERVHRVLNTIDCAPFTTIAAVHGVVFGGGFELALACDLIVADKLARFCFPELRLGLVPGFGGLARLKRDAGNGIVRDLLLSGRSINAARAQAAGLVSQVAGEGRALEVARGMAVQAAKFDLTATAAAKRLVKPIPTDELAAEIDTFCELFARPAVAENLRKFTNSRARLPYLP